jgi:hypothetical protein
LFLIQAGAARSREREPGDQRAAQFVGHLLFDPVESVDSALRERELSVTFQKSGYRLRACSDGHPSRRFGSPRAGMPISKGSRAGCGWEIGPLVRRFSNRPLDVELLRVLEGSPDEATLLRYVSADNGLAPSGRAGSASAAA